MRGIGARKQSRARNRLPDGPPTTPPNEEQLRGEEGAQALVDLARRNSGHSQGSNGSPDEPVHRRGVGEASSTDGGASNSAAMSAPMPVVGRYSQVEKTHATQFDFEAHVDWKIQTELRNLLPEIKNAVAAAVQQNVAAHIDQLTAKFRAEMASLNSQMEDCTSQLRSLRGDLQTVFTTAVRDDDILARKIEEIGNLAGTVRHAVDQTRWEIAARARNSNALGFIDATSTGEGTVVPSIAAPRPRPVQRGLQTAPIIARPLTGSSSSSITSLQKLNDGTASPGQPHRRAESAPNPVDRVKPVLVPTTGRPHSVPTLRGSRSITRLDDAKQSVP